MKPTLRAATAANENGWQQTPADQPQLDPLTRRSEEVDENGVVLGLMKHLGPPVPPMENVVAPIPQRSSCGSRQAGYPRQK